MLCHWLYQTTNIDLFDGRLFRAGVAAMLSIILVLFFMPKYIRFLQRLDATSDFDKDGKTKSPPIMGGLLLVIVVEIVSLLVCQMNGYTISTLVILALFSAVGATDDMAKVRAKRLVNQGKLKAAEYMDKADGISSSLRLFLYFLFSFVVAVFCYKFIPELKGDLTIPFCPIDVFQIHLPNWIFVAFMTFVIAASANGTNFTDGLDSLVSVPILTSMVFVGLVAYVSGNFIFSQYLSVPYLPGCDELFPLATAIAGALLAYLWFNSPPAEIYMGDAGSVGFGAAIGIMFLPPHRMHHHHRRSLLCFDANYMVQDYQENYRYWQAHLPLRTAPPPLPKEVGWPLPEQAPHELQDCVAHAPREHLRPHLQHGCVLRY